MKAYPRIIFRQPASALEGGKSRVLNDGLEVVLDGEVVADLSEFVTKIEVIDEVGGARRFRIEMLAGEVAVETEEPM